MAAKFSIIKDRAGKYRFNLKSSNGEIIAASESYSKVWFNTAELCSG